MLIVLQYNFFHPTLLQKPSLLVFEHPHAMPNVCCQVGQSSKNLPSAFFSHSSQVLSPIFFAGSGIDPSFTKRTCTNSFTTDMKLRTIFKITRRCQFKCMGTVYHSFSIIKSKFISGELWRVPIWTQCTSCGECMSQTSK